MIISKPNKEAKITSRTTADYSFPKLRKFEIDKTQCTKVRIKV